MTQSYTIPETAVTGARTVTSHNALIMTSDYYYEYCIGGKTGYTDSAMNTFVSAAEKDGRTLIEVTMYSPTAGDSFINAKTLYEYGFNNFTNHVVCQGTNLYSGGSVTLPNGVTTDVLQTQEGETFYTSFGDMVSRNYFYNEYQVGQAAITEESYLEERRLIAEAEAQAEAEAEAEREKTDLEKLQELKDSAMTKPLLDPISGELFTTSHIIIFVFAGLILLGVLTIIITVIVKRIRKKRKALKKKYKK